MGAPEDGRPLHELTAPIGPVLTGGLGTEKEYLSGHPYATELAVPNPSGRIARGAFFPFVLVAGTLTVPHQLRINKPTRAAEAAAATFGTREGEKLRLPSCFWLHDVNTYPPTSYLMYM